MGNMSAPSYASPPMRSLVDPGVAEAVIDADGRGNKVLDLAAGNGRKLQFEHPRHRHVFDQDFLRLLVDFLTLGIRGRDRAFGKQLVDLGVGITLDVVELLTFDDLAGDVVAADAERRIAILIEIGECDVVVPVADLLVRTGYVGGDGLDVQADILQVLLHGFTPALPGLAVRKWHQPDLFAVVAGFLQQRLGLCRVVGVFRHVVGVELDAGRRRAGGNLAKPVPDHVFGEVAVHSVHNGLTNLLVRGRTGAIVEPHPGQWAEELPAGAGHAGILEFADARNVEIFHRAAGQNIDLAGLVGDRAGRGIRDDLPVDLVNKGFALDVIVRIFHEPDERALLPFLEHERTGPDRRVIVRIGLEVGALIEMFRNDRHRT